MGQRQNTDLFISREDIDFYRDLSLAHDNKALELGVGTGRVAIELAKAGLTVCGIDASIYMLSEASKKLRRQNSTFGNRLKLGDMRNFKTETLFPLIHTAS